jgi:hypothetical protein
MAEKNKLMRYLKTILNHARLAGFIFLAAGFFLMPLFIGVPIFIIGILLLIFNFYRTWINLVIPKSIQVKIGQEIKRSYKPYQPALSSLKTIGRDIGKTAAWVFLVLVLSIMLGLILLYVRH